MVAPLMTIAYPAPFYGLKQWCTWRLEYKPGAVKATKVPYDCKTGFKASSTDQSTLSDYSDAVTAMATGTYNGVGFFFSETDNYFLIDLDGCIDSETGALSDEAKAITGMFPGAAWEYSQSGEGIHIVGQCDVATLGPRRNKIAGWIEFYTHSRFVAMGPHGWQGNASIDWTNVIAMIIPQRPEGESEDVVIAERDPRWNGPEDDEVLIAKMLSAIGGTKAKLGTGPTNRQLWDAEPGALSKFYPRHGGNDYDASQADQALMNVLAFWTGKDHVRMIRLFSRI